MELLTMLVVSQSGDHVFAGYDEVHVWIRLMISGRIKITIAVSYQLELKITKDGDTYWYVMVSSSSVVSNISFEIGWKFFSFFDSFSIRFLYLRVPDEELIVTKISSSRVSIVQKIVSDHWVDRGCSARRFDRSRWRRSVHLEIWVMDDRQR